LYRSIICFGALFSSMNADEPERHRAPSLTHAEEIVILAAYRVRIYLLPGRAAGRLR
jgi:hypothetical protein